MEKKLLDRAEAIEALNKEIEKVKPPFNDTLGAIRHGVRLARNIIEDLPVESKQERRLGRWIRRGGEPEWGPDGPGTIVVRWPWAECSECKGRALETEHGAALTPFCPLCGARMDLPKEAKE